MWTFRRGKKKKKAVLFFFQYGKDAGREGGKKLEGKSLRKLDYTAQLYIPAGMKCWRGSCVVVEKVPQGLALKPPAQSQPRSMAAVLIRQEILLKATALSSKAKTWSCLKVPKAAACPRASPKSSHTEIWCPHSHLFSSPTALGAAFGGAFLSSLQPQRWSSSCSWPQQS